MSVSLARIAELIMSPFTSAENKYLIVERLTADEVRRVMKLMIMESEKK